MKIAAISDLHIYDSTDPTYKKLLSFMSYVSNNPEISHMVLLGDIFDLMIGPHKEYLSEYEDFFNKLVYLSQQGKQTFYFEGNHDLHLKKLFSYIQQHYSLQNSLKLFTKAGAITISGCNIYFSHGDELEQGDWHYELYKKAVRSSITSILANYIVPYKMINYIGRRASQASKNNNKRKQIPESKIRDNFRKGASRIVKRQSDLDIIISAHSHIRDETLINNKTLFLNIGSVRSDNTFLELDPAKRNYKFISVPDIL